MGANVIFVVWSNALCYRTNKIGCDHIRALDRYQANRQRYERNARNKPHTTDYMHESEEKIIIWFNRIAVIFNVYWIRMQCSLPNYSAIARQSGERVRRAMYSGIFIWFTWPNRICRCLAATSWNLHQRTDTLADMARDGWWWRWSTWFWFLRSCSV